MAHNVHELRPKPPETEKITINLGYVDLGHVDLMVQEGFYSNRTDFIRTAIRNQLERHADVVKQSTARKGLDLGLRNYAARISKRRGKPVRCCTSMSSALPPSRKMSRPTCPRHHCLGFRAGSPACHSRGQGRSCRQDEVKTMLNQDMLREATRLTRAGQLAEATALLQRMLCGERAPHATLRTAGGLALIGREPPTIDAKANTIEETDSVST